MTQYTDWQIDQLGCDCIYHRYQTVYICGGGKLVSHSQADWDVHRLHPNGINIDSKWYKHDDTASKLFDRMTVYGLLPYGTNEFDTVYSRMADLQEQQP